MTAARSARFRYSTIGLGILLALAAGAGLARAAPREPAVHSVAVEIVFGTPPGPERLRDRVTESVVDLLGASRCFAAVEPARTEGQQDLLLRVMLDEFEDATRHDASIGERVSPNSNPMDLASRVVAVVSALVRLELRVGGEGGALVRSKRFLAAESHRPQHLEDPRPVAEDRFVERLARDIRAFACKGDPAKLSREIDRALEAR